MFPLHKSKCICLDLNKRDILIKPPGVNLISLTSHFENLPQILEMVCKAERFLKKSQPFY
jgi:hypothetical protein